MKRIMKQHGCEVFVIYPEDTGERAKKYCLQYLAERRKTYYEKLHWEAGDDWDRFDPEAEYVVLVHNGQVLCGARLIFPEKLAGERLPVLNQVTSSELVPDDAVEISRLINPSRNLFYTRILYGALYAYLGERGIRSYLASTRACLAKVFIHRRPDFSVIKLPGKGCYHGEGRYRSGPFYPYLFRAAV